MKKQLILVLFLVLGTKVSYWLETTYTAPTFQDIASFYSDSTCQNSDPIGFDESDGNNWITNTINYYCIGRGYDWWINFNADTSATDPDICETNSWPTANTIRWRFDTSATDDFIDITCFIDDSKVWCTDPNASNYDPQHTREDWSCNFWGWWTWTGSTWDVNVVINGWEGINKSIFDLETLQDIYQMEALLMFFLVFMKFFNRITTSWKPNRSFVNKVWG